MQNAVDWVIGMLTAIHWCFVWSGLRCARWKFLIEMRHYYLRVFNVLCSVERNQKPRNLNQRSRLKLVYTCRPILLQWKFYKYHNSSIQYNTIYVCACVCVYVCVCVCVGGWVYTCCCCITFVITASFFCYFGYNISFIYCWCYAVYLRLV